MPEEPIVPAEADKTKEPAKEPEKAPEITSVKDIKAEDDDVPEKFKGKSASEIAKSYLELEKKLGEKQTDTEKETLAKEVAQWRELGKFIENDPDAIKTLEASIKRQRGINDDPAKDGEKPHTDDTRLALQNNIINDFEKSYGIDSLEPDKRTAMHKKIGDQLADMFDPTGKRTYSQIINEIPLNKLGTYLDKAYKVATVDDAEERGRTKALLEARQNREGTMGSMPSSNGSNDSITLTSEQRAVAQKLGISEEKYKAQLKKINSE
jgi:hypothetical protein